MDTLIVLLAVVFIGTLIAYIILNLFKKENKILNIVIFTSYTAFVLIGAAVNEPMFMQGVSTFLIMEVMYIFVLNLIQIIKDKDNMEKWLIGECGLMVLYTISYIVTNPNSTYITDGISEGLIYPIGILYILVMVLIGRKRQCAKLFIKVLAVYYVIFMVAFAFSPPIEFASVLVSFGFTLVIGFILALVMFAMYKTNLKFIGKSKKVEAAKEKGDFS